MSGKDPVWDRINRQAGKDAGQEQRTVATTRSMADGELARVRHALSALAAARGTDTEIEVIHDVPGLRGRLARDVFTMSEYISGKNNTSTIQKKLRVAEKTQGWLFANVFQWEHDPDSRVSPPTSLVIASDGRNWSDIREAYGGEGRVYGVLQAGNNDWSTGTDRTVEQMLSHAASFSPAQYQAAPIVANMQRLVAAIEARAAGQ